MKRLLCALLAMVLALGCALAEAADVYAADGDKTIILDKDGLTIWLTGDYEATDNFNGKAGNVMSRLKCVVENNTGATINVQYTCVVNGWNIDSYHTMDGANSLPNATKAKSGIWFTTEDCDVTRYADLETMVLYFQVRDENGGDLYKVSTGTIHFNNAGAPAEEAPAEEAPTEAPPAALDAAAVEAQLKGEWHSQDGGSLAFANGNMTMKANGSEANGTYTIDVEAQRVDILIQTLDGEVSAHLPFTFENGVLTLYNNRGEALQKDAAGAEPAGAEPSDTEPTAEPAASVTTDAQSEPEADVLPIPGAIVKAGNGNYHVYIRFRNNTDESIDKIDFTVYSYDASGNNLRVVEKETGYVGDSFGGILDDQVIDPGKTSRRVYWEAEGVEGDIRSVMVGVDYYHTTGGKHVSIPHDEVVLVSSKGGYTIGEPDANSTNSAASGREYGTLQNGSKGEDVKKLQQRLIALGYLSGSADGIYGKGTEGGVKKFQAAEGLAQTGVADAETQARLFDKPLPEKPVIAVLPTKLRVNSAGTTELYVRFRNDGDVTIDRLDFCVSCYDTYGDKIKGYGRYDLSDNYYDHEIRPGATSDSDWHWGLYGFDGTSRVRIAVYRYHTTDGDTVDIPGSKLQWIDFE